MQQRSRTQRIVNRQEQFVTAIDDAEVLIEFASEDPASFAELRTHLSELSIAVEEAETEMLLSGENDARNAICTLHPGAGGTDAQDWAEMLLRMYMKWAEAHDFKLELIEIQPGQEAGTWKQRSGGGR